MKKKALETLYLQNFIRMLNLNHLQWQNFYLKKNLGMKMDKWIHILHCYQSVKLTIFVSYQSYAVKFEIFKIFILNFWSRYLIFIEKKVINFHLSRWHKICLDIDTDSDHLIKTLFYWRIHFHENMCYVFQKCLIVLKVLQIATEHKCF